MTGGDSTNLSVDQLHISPLSEETRRKAALTCARQAMNAPELREYLEMLGLIDMPPRVLPLDPSGRRKATPEGAQVRRDWYRAKKAKEAG